MEGDILRHGISVDPGISPEELPENNRRIDEVAVLFANMEFLVIAALTPPFPRAS